MRERITEISFDELGRGPTYVGSIVRLNESVNVLRIFFENLDDEDANLKISLKRADGQKGSDLCDRVLDSSNKLKYFQYVLNGWCTAIPGDLKISFSLIYSELFEEKIEDGTVVEIYPIDTQRMVTIKVDPAVGPADEVIKTPNVVDSLVIRTSALEDGYVNDGALNVKAELDNLNKQLVHLEDFNSNRFNELNLEMATFGDRINTVQMATKDLNTNINSELVNIDKRFESLQVTSEELTSINQKLTKIEYLNTELVRLDERLNDIQLSVIEQELAAIELKANNSELTLDEANGIKVQLAATTNKIELIQTSATSNLFTDRLVTVQTNASLIDSKLDLVLGGTT